MIEKLGYELSVDPFEAILQLAGKVNELVDAVNLINRGMDFLVNELEKEKNDDNSRIAGN